MAKIVLIGAGSYVFSRDIITEILQYPNLSSSDVVLVDIDKERLDIMTALTKKNSAAARFKNKDIICRRP
jgi:alpha-galactosidase